MSNAIRIQDYVDKETLSGMVEGFVAFLGTSGVIYEANGEMAVELVTRDFCKSLVEASEKEVEKGKGLCHEERWRVSLESIKRRQCHEDVCHGTLTFISCPIFLDGRVIGVVNGAFGNPPTDEAKLNEIAGLYGLELDRVKRIAEESRRVPEFSGAARKHVELSTRIISRLVKTRYEEKKHTERLALASRIQAVLFRSLDLQDILPGVLEELMKSLQAYSCYICLVEPKTGELNVPCFCDASGPTTLIPPHLLEGPQTEGIRNALRTSNPQHIETQEGYSTEYIPLRHLSIIGVMAIEFHEPRKDKELPDLLESLGGQIALVIQNCRLYEESVKERLAAAQRVEFLELIKEVDRLVLTEMDIRKAFEKICLLVRSVIPCDRVTFVRVNEEKEEFEYIAGWGVDFPKGFRVPMKETDARWVVVRKAPVYRPDLSKETLAPFDTELFKQGFQSDLRVPIKSHGKVTALLNLGSHSKATFNPQHLELAQAISNQLSIAMENATLFERLKALLLNTVKCLSIAIDAKSRWTMGHSERVASWSEKIALSLGLETKAVEDLRIASLLHDIGKIGTGEELLDKPGLLTQEERAVVERHAVRGADILSPLKEFEEIAKAIRHHHERYNGKGYPGGLRGEDTPLFSQIIAMADTWDALTTERPYRKTLSREEALEEVRRCAGSQFDPEIVRAFEMALREEAR
ncbi:MAG: GAF domain-containing protein [Candidatus Brocadiales bacterium]|nr:GAF domain-containing protein [Candidatus Brocadiales bacterium]